MPVQDRIEHDSIARPKLVAHVHAFRPHILEQPLRMDYLHGNLAAQADAFATVQLTIGRQLARKGTGWVSRAALKAWPVR
jgi:hypothetical protein